jgi:hypothetical protein
LTVEFFNFGNDETFHFFKWICESVPAGPERLITDAFRQSEQRDDDEIPGEDVCYIVRSRLTATLERILWEEVAPDLDPDIGVVNVQIGVIPRTEHGKPSADLLLQPILSLALQRINLAAVAEALLIRAGKWNPSKEPPELV